MQCKGSSHKHSKSQVFITNNSLNNFRQQNQNFPRGDHSKKLSVAKKRSLVDDVSDVEAPQAKRPKLTKHGQKSNDSKMPLSLRPQPITKQQVRKTLVCTQSLLIGCQWARQFGGNKIKNICSTPWEMQSPSPPSLAHGQVWIDLTNSPDPVETIKLLKHTVCKTPSFGSQCCELVQENPSVQWDQPLHPTRVLKTVKKSSLLPFPLVLDSTHKQSLDNYTQRKQWAISTSYSNRFTDGPI